MTHRAVALFSGGLDSTLAILTVLRQGIEVKALKFLTQFGCEAPACSKNIFSVAERFGFEVKIVNLSDKFLGIVKNPKFGYGRNVNPCIDCRILMLKEAKVFMNMIVADFIITGEVLGQRPMSQRKDTFYLIDKEAGVTDYVLRPLSAKLLKVTAPEARGIISRDTLYDLRGRSRKPQIALAREFGLAGYPAPAGGCLLTEPNYAHRLKDLLTYNPDPDFKDLNLLKIGRHFRFSPSCKIIVGRNRTENETIKSLSDNGDYLLKVEGYGSPTTLVAGEVTNETLRVAASICVRCSDAKNLSDVEVAVFKGGSSFRLKIQPANTDLLENYRIEKKSNRVTCIAKI
ncbi:MAG: 7-cyano-7-deazaguanine synthase [Nitrospirota bacterium]